MKQLARPLSRALLFRLDEHLYEKYEVEPFPSRPNGEPDDVPVGELVKSRGNPEQGGPSPILGIEKVLN